MIKRLFFAGALALAASVTVLADERPDINDLAWLAGDWIGEGREGDDGAVQGIARQHWTPPLEGSVSYLFTWHDASSAHVHYAINVFRQTSDGITGKGVHHGRDFETFEDNPWHLEVATIGKNFVRFRCIKFCRSESVTFSMRDDDIMEERWRLNEDENRPDWIVEYRRAGTSD